MRQECGVAQVQLLHATQQSAGCEDGHTSADRTGFKQRCPDVESYHRMYSLISFRKSTPPQESQLNILISDSKQEADDYVGELTFAKHFL